MSQHLVSTPPVIIRCPRCRVLILTALDEGLPARVDLTPLNNAGEIAALLDGRWTYTQTRTELIHREAGRIAGGRLTQYPILATHRCHTTIPPEHRETTAPPPTPANSEEIPF